MSRLCPNFKLWVYSVEDEGVFGDGKVRLLKAIQDHGSLREAASSLEISYRKAWGDLRKAEKCLRMKLVDRSRGGYGGGRTVLTDGGQKLITAYTSFRQKADFEVEEAFNQFLTDLDQ